METKLKTIGAPFGSSFQWEHFSCWRGTSLLLPMVQDNLGAPPISHIPLVLLHLVFNE